MFASQSINQFLHPYSQPDWADWMAMEHSTHTSTSAKVACPCQHCHQMGWTALGPSTLVRAERSTIASNQMQSPNYAQHHCACKLVPMSKKATSNIERHMLAKELSIVSAQILKHWTLKDHVHHATIALSSWMIGLSSWNCASSIPVSASSILTSHGFHVLVKCCQCQLLALISVCAPAMHRKQNRI